MTEFASTYREQSYEGSCGYVVTIGIRRTWRHGAIGRGPDGWFEEPFPGHSDGRTRRRTSSIWVEG